jgi:hypothetical protein
MTQGNSDLERWKKQEQEADDLEEILEIEEQELEHFIEEDEQDLQ